MEEEGVLQVRGNLSRRELAAGPEGEDPAVRHHPVLRHVLREAGGREADRWTSRPGPGQPR